MFYIRKCIEEKELAKFMSDYLGVHLWTGEVKPHSIVPLHYYDFWHHGAGIRTFMEVFGYHFSKDEKCALGISLAGHFGTDLVTNTGTDFGSEYEWLNVSESGALNFAIETDSEKDEYFEIDMLINSRSLEIASKIGSSTRSSRR